VDGVCGGDAIPFDPTVSTVDPRARPADVLAGIADLPASRLHELLPWNRQKPPVETATAA
jgi:transposase